MAEISPAGIQPLDLTGYVERLEEALRSALGADLSVEEETPQGQLAGILGLVFTEVEELAVHVAAGLNRYSAVGRQLADYGTLFGIRKISGERSSVVATLSGSASTVVDAGSRARTTAGAVFASVSQAIIGSSGTVDVLMRSVDVGPIVAAIGELTQLVDVIPGWTGVTERCGSRAGSRSGTG